MKAGEPLKNEIKERVQSKTGDLIWDLVRGRARIAVKTHLALGGWRGTWIEYQVSRQVRDAIGDS